MSKKERTTVAVSHTHRGLREHIDVVEETSAAHKMELLRQKKLIMLLDLDMTVIHATRGEIAGNTIPAAMAKYPQLKEEIYQFEAGEMFWMKLRPGAREFIAEASKKFEIHVYTASARSYANQICGILDPNNLYFHGRVLTRTESPHAKQKYIERLFPFSVEMVVVVDDSSRAWSTDKGLYHLYNIHPFVFFKDFKQDLVAPPAVESPETSWKELYWINSHSWRDNDLHYCIKSLSSVHENFYNTEPRVSVNHILSHTRGAVLQNVNILFSSVFPKVEKPHE